MNDIKPGWQTTEFWKSLATQVVGALVIFHVINVSDAADIGQRVQVVVEGIFAAAALISPLLSYVKNRTELKMAALKASAKVRIE